MHNKEISNASPAISIVICTYNRADLLDQLMKSLLFQTVSPDQFEIIIIDNNSSDATRDICNSVIAKNPLFRIRYFLEMNQGLSHARNRGWSEAQGVYVGYLDDDCKVPHEWLQVAQSCIAFQAPDIFGGPYYAFYNSEKPPWFKDEYGSHVSGLKPRALAPDEYLDGGNLFIKRALLKNLNGFKTYLGMTGNSLGYGEETELQIRIRQEYPESIIMYYPELFVYHLVRKEKMVLRSIIHQNFQSGRYGARMMLGNSTPKKITGQILGNLFYGAALTAVFLVRLLCRNPSQYPYIQNYLYEEGGRIVSIIGFLYEIMLSRPKRPVRKTQGR